MPVAKPVAAGQMDRRLEIQEAKEEKNEFGEMEQTWRTIAIRWCCLEPLSGRELWQAQQIRPDLTHKIRLRYSAAVTAKHRGKIGTRIFQFDPPTNPGEQGGTTEMVIMAKEEV